MAKLIFHVLPWSSIRAVDTAKVLEPEVNREGSSVPLGTQEQRCRISVMMLTFVRLEFVSGMHVQRSD